MFHLFFCDTSSASRILVQYRILCTFCFLLLFCTVGAWRFEICDRIVAHAVEEKKIYAFQKVDEDSGYLFDLEDLLAVVWSSDANLAFFMASWETVVQGLAEEQTDKTLQLLCWRQIKQCKLLKEEMSAYKRAKKGDAIKTYSYFTDCVKDHLATERQESNRGQIAFAIPGKVPAVAAVGDADKAVKKKDKQDKAKAAKK